MRSFRAASPWNVYVGVIGSPVGVWRKTEYDPVTSSTATTSGRPSRFRSPTAIGPIPGAERLLSYTVRVGNPAAGGETAETRRATNARATTGARNRRARRFMLGHPWAPRGHRFPWG